MTRMSKQAKRRTVSPRRNKGPTIKTGSKTDQIPNGYKFHINALENGDGNVFIAKIK